MALQDIVSRRLIKALEKISRVAIGVGQNPTLGDIGFDGSSLRQVQDGLNGNEVGFADLLTDSRLIQNDLRVSSRVSDLVQTILQKSTVRTDAEYEAKITERVRLGLRRIIAAMAAIDEQQVVPSENITRYLPNLDQRVEQLRAELTREFEKYLFSSITRDDLHGTVGRIQRRLVNRMVL